MVGCDETQGMGEFEEASRPSARRHQRNILEALHHWAGVQPEKVWATWLDDEARVSRELTYAQLLRSVEALAQDILFRLRIKPYEPVLLVYPPSLDFIIAFLACLRAGVIAVPVFPPDPSQAKKELGMLVAVRNNCGARVALTASSYSKAKTLGDLKSLFLNSPFSRTSDKWPDLKWFATDGGSSAHSSHLPAIERHADDLAFLQYTSGSTSEPKGVMITHGNLSHNLTCIVTALKAGTDTVVASWLPQYHDMGLIGSYLGAIYCGGSGPDVRSLIVCGWCVPCLAGCYMSPVTFIRRPWLWVEVMSDYRATHMQAPNFAYGLVARKWQARGKVDGGRTEKVDLSSVRHMINGAEPVDIRTMETFYVTFEKYGLKRGVVYPTYGLAENTVFVCSNGRLRVEVDRRALEEQGLVKEVINESGGEVNTSMKLAGCGNLKQSAELGIEVVVVDCSSGRVLEDGYVGEIWVRGASRAAGYYRKQSSESFAATTAGSGQQDMQTLIHRGNEYVNHEGFLRTGDQGFRYKGELFITGRVKDLIIIRGRNIYPQDIERAIEAVFDGSLRGGCSAALSMPLTAPTEDEDEVVVYCAEVKEELLRQSAQLLAQLAQQVRQLVATEHGVSLSAVYLLKPRTIPKTTSGKIARSWCRKAMQEGRLQALCQWVKSDDQSETEALPTSEEPVQEKCSTRANVNSTGTGDDAKVLDGKADPPVENGEETDVMNTLRQQVAGITKNAPSIFMNQGSSGRLYANASFPYMPAAGALSSQTPVTEICEDAPLMTLGLDSMQGMQLHAKLEERFGFPIPEAVILESDTSLKTLATVVARKGVLPPAATLIDVAQLCDLQTEYLRKSKRSELRPNTRQELLNKCSIKSPLLTGRFSEGQLLEAVPCTWSDTLIAYLAVCSTKPWSAAIGILPLLALTVSRGQSTVVGPLLPLFLGVAALTWLFAGKNIFAVLHEADRKSAEALTSIHASMTLRGAERVLLAVLRSVAVKRALFRRTSFKLVHEGGIGSSDVGHLLVFAEPRDTEPHRDLLQILTCSASEMVFGCPWLLHEPAPANSICTPASLLHVRRSQELEAALRRSTNMAVPAGLGSAADALMLQAALLSAVRAKAVFVPAVTISSGRGPLSVVLGRPISCVKPDSHSCELSTAREIETVYRAAVARLLEQHDKSAVGEQ